MPCWFLIGLWASSILLPKATGQQIAVSEDDGILAAVVIRSSLVEKRVQEQRRESEPVTKELLGNPVQGCQTTITETRLRIVPDARWLHAEIITSGTVTSRTETRNPQALIHSDGLHRFEITKPVYINGPQLLTNKGYGVIQASQNPVRVMSIASMLPLIGPAADQIAWSEVLRRSPRIDRALAEDLSRDIIPRVDAGVDAELSKLNSTIQSIIPRVESLLQVSGQQLSTDSTEQSVRGLILSKELAGQLVLRQPNPDRERVAPDIELADKEDVLVVLNDHLLNDVINRFVPGGLIITDNQLNRLRAGLSKLLQSDDSPGMTLDVIQRQAERIAADLFTPEAGVATVFSVELAAQAPLQVIFSQGRITLRLTLRVIPTFGGTSQWMVIESRWKGITVDDNRWALTNDGITVIPVKQQLSEDFSQPLRIPQGSEPASQPDGPTQEQYTAGDPPNVMTTLVEQMSRKLLNDLTPPAIPREFSMQALAELTDVSVLSGSVTEEAPGSYRIHRIRADRHRLILSLRQVEAGRTSE
ncbi:MAG: hypothetical protein R3C20_25030 [Planctomycetaceae bacterium]